MNLVLENFEAPEVLDIAELIGTLAEAIIEEAKSEDGLKLSDVPAIISKASDKFMPAIEGASNIKLELKKSPADVVTAFLFVGRKIAKKMEA